MLFRSGGTYFPPQDHWGRPGFKRVLLSIANAFREKHAEVAEHAAQHALVHTVGVAGISAAAHTQLTGHLAQLAEQVLPLADAQVVQVLVAAQPPELVARQRLLLLAQVGPQTQEGDEVARRVDEARVLLVGLGVPLALCVC